MCPRPQYIDLTYMGGAGSCGPMRLIFKSYYTSLNIEFGPHRTFKIMVYRFGLYGRYHILWTHIAQFQYRSAYG